MVWVDDCVGLATKGINCWLIVVDILQFAQFLSKTPAHSRFCHSHGAGAHLHVNRDVARGAVFDGCEPEGAPGAILELAADSLVRSR
jgi:hypothetical protein